VDEATVANEKALREMLTAVPEWKPPLELIGVSDRNVPNQERIVLKANGNVRLNEYLIIAGVALIERQQILPMNDYLFWPGNHAVDAGAWVLIYTGVGQPRTTADTTTRAPILVLHWGRSHTIFSLPAIVPALIRPAREGTQIGPEGR
jgi:hypothetical protein